MKTIALIAVLIAGSGLAQQPGVNRTDLQRHDLSIPGREAVQVRVDIGPGTTFPKRKLRNNMDNCWKIRFGGEPKSYSSMRDGLCVVGSGSLRVARRSL